jgi:NAD(P)H-nitrite reductase large subunit
MQTTDPDIFACGDAAQFGRGVPLWVPALKQGTVAGTNAAGGDISFAKEDYPAALNAFGIRLISIGETSEELSNYSKTDEQSYRKLFFKDGKTVGGILINDSANTMKVLNAVKNSEDEQTARKIF